jgi:hypothetical protein
MKSLRAAGLRLSQQARAKSGFSRANSTNAVVRGRMPQRVSDVFDVGQVSQHMYAAQTHYEEARREAIIIICIFLVRHCERLRRKYGFGRRWLRIRIRTLWILA